MQNQPNTAPKKKPGDYPQIVFRLDETLQTELEKRRRDGYSLNIQAREDLMRYYALLANKAREMQNLFTLGEIMLMCDACNGTIFEPHTLGLLRLNIEDSISYDATDRKWEIDGAELLEKLGALSLEGTATLVDVIERFWAGVSQGKPMAHEAETFADLGLRVKE